MLIFSLLLNMQSHPTWVRGLKHRHRTAEHTRIKSHPTWVRGLKLTLCQIQLNLIVVAPYMGAWIET